MSYKDFEDEDEFEAEIPRGLLSRLITWLRMKGITDKDIVDCMLYICSPEEEKDGE